MDTARPTIWFNDANNRHYDDGASGPVWRKQWRKLDIEGETRVSWIVRPFWLMGKTVTRVPKDWSNWSWRGHFALSEQEIDDRALIHEHGHRLAACISNVRDISVFRQIAALVGYKLPE